MKAKYLSIILVMGLSSCTSNNAEIAQLKSDIKKLQVAVERYEKNEPHSITINKLKPTKLDIQGLSYGGIVRAEATMNSPKLMSFKYGEKVNLLERTAEIKDRYHWFKVKSQSGVEGYQWGGLLCSFSHENVGTFRLCSNF